MLQHSIHAVSAIMYRWHKRTLVSFVCLSLCPGFVLLAIPAISLERKNSAPWTEEYVRPIYVNQEFASSLRIVDQ